MQKLNKIDIHSSTTFTVPKGVKKIDAFCVGGGGHSGRVYSFQDPEFPNSYPSWYGAGGGGGGYTKTVLGVDVTPGQQISVVVGAGGGNGGSLASASSVGDICGANGGTSAIYNFGRAGGSGGGGGSSQRKEPAPLRGNIVSGGKDGGDGSDCILYGRVASTGGKGQGTTTRYFGESTGTLYSTGGWGCFYVNPSIKHGDANTGDGGNGNCANGGSGICIIRWTKDYFE